jgi:hypothetical protein
MWLGFSLHLLLWLKNVYSSTTAVAWEYSI